MLNLSKSEMSSRLMKIASAAAFVSALSFGASIAEAGTILGSKHDLGTGGGGQGAGGTGEVCVFCHTPHGSDSTANVPLWNKKTPDPATFTTYSTSTSATLDGDVATVGSVSLACLSCHDGSQAMDSVLNAPGSGLYAAAGSNINAGATMSGTVAAPGAGGLIPVLGKDLTNDHPIGIEYGDQTSDAASFVASSNANGQYWVNGNGSTVAGREKTDMILYTRDGDATPRVECASCHDPHNGPDAGVSNIFLRISNDDSDVCLSCHVK